MNDLELSRAIEDALVARNPRGMKTLQAAMTPGYYLRAAQLLENIDGNVIIGTGFPVAGSFETDGPVGAIALYEALESLGATPWIACAPPLADRISDRYRVVPLTITDVDSAITEAREQLAKLQPKAVISIERPGLTEDGRYYNMRGVDISEHCGVFDPFITEANCPTIGAGDGGNEIGMGNLRETVAGLSINGAITTCDELVIADVSNWAAYGLIALLGRCAGRDLLSQIQPVTILEYLSELGSVDGVTGENTITEDGMAASEGLAVLRELQTLVADTEAAAS